MDRGHRLEIAAFLVVLLILSCTWFTNRASRHTEKVTLDKNTSRSVSMRKTHEARSVLSKSSFSIDDPDVIVSYISHVINEGSNILGFPGGEMEGGYVDSSVAPRIACYVLELSGRKCPHEYPKDAAMYFSSVCAGCHGNDAKGLHGSFPDLTRERLLGIERFVKNRFDRDRSRDSL